MVNSKEKTANIGISNTLGQSELEILHILWCRGEATVRQVYEEIRGSRNVTLPAVMLSMERLTRRGVIQKSKGDRAAIYRPLLDREVIGHSIISDVIDKVLQGNAGLVVSHLVSRLTESELEKIRTMIRDAKES